MSSDFCGCQRSMKQSFIKSLKALKFNCFSCSRAYDCENCKQLLTFLSEEELRKFVLSNNDLRALIKEHLARLAGPDLAVPAQAPAEPPASRLVGIELNPGPKSKLNISMSSMPAVVREVVAAVLSSVPKQTAGEQKKKRKRRRARAPGADSSVGSNRSSSSVSAPSTVGLVIRGAQGGRGSIQPFSAYAGALSHTGGGSVIRVFSANGLNSNESGRPYAIQFNVMNIGANDTPLLGITNGGGIQRLTRSYVRWRLNKLRIRYVPYRGTNTAGSIVLGVGSDAGINNPSIVDSPSICSYPCSVQTPVWQTATLDCTRFINRAWLNTDVELTGTLTDPTLRACAAGHIIVGSLGLDVAGASDVTLGHLELEGEVEFTELTNDSAAY